MKLTSGTPPIRTRVAHAEWGTNRYVGYDVRTELLGQESYVGLVFLAIAGRRPDENERGLLEDIAVAMTVADPRIWPLKLGRIAASYGGCLAGVAAINVCLEGGYVGHWTSLQAAQLLIDAGDELGPLTADPARMEDWMRRRLESGQRLFGFGVPFRPTDERVEMLTACVERRNRASLRGWKLFENVAGAARVVRKLEPNIGLAVAGGVSRSRARTRPSADPRRSAWPKRLLVQRDRGSGTAGELASRAPRRLRGVRRHSGPHEPSARVVSYPMNGKLAPRRFQRSGMLRRKLLQTRTSNPTRGHDTVAWMTSASRLARKHEQFA